MPPAIHLYTFWSVTTPAWPPLTELAFLHVLLTQLMNSNRKNIPKSKISMHAEKIKILIKIEADGWLI